MSVTIAIPTYNSEFLIEDCLSSVFNQTTKIDNIFINDDCSSDYTLDIISKIKERYPEKNIRVRTNSKNLGYQCNWNECLINAPDSDYILILHQDDLLKPNAIEILRDYLVNNESIALVGGKADYLIDNEIYEESKNVDDSYFQAGNIYEFVKIKSSYIECSSVMFRRALIPSYGMFNPEIAAADEELWPRILQHYPIAVLGVSIIIRRIHSNQTSAKFGIIKNYMKNEYLKFLRIVDYEKRLWLKRKLLSELKKKYVNSSLHLANRYLIKENKNALCNNLISAFKISPLHSLSKRTFYRLLLKSLVLRI